MTFSNDKTVNAVKEFWENNPLWIGESKFQPGTREFFEEHSSVYITDCFAGKIDLRTLPLNSNCTRVLDLGCGPGFWTVELAYHGCKEIYAADLTENAIELATKRAKLFDIDVIFSQQNAELTTFPDNFFNHVNCQGVIHHTPDTEACVREIARILRKDGTAVVSVYYRNVFLRYWPFFRWAGKILYFMGGGLKGRGREKIFLENDVDEITRIYDGDANPIGKSYSSGELIELLSPYFEVTETFLHFFPARTIPFKIPCFLHEWLDKNCGFMIYASVRKR